jgi:hypothetical protein
MNIGAFSIGARVVFDGEQGSATDQLRIAAPFWVELTGTDTLAVLSLRLLPRCRLQHEPPHLLYIKTMPAVLKTKSDCASDMRGRHAGTRFKNIMTRT